MIGYGVGVTPTDTYTLVRIDSDNFDLTTRPSRRRSNQSKAVAARGPIRKGSPRGRRIGSEKGPSRYLFATPETTPCNVASRYLFRRLGDAHLPGPTVDSQMFVNAILTRWQRIGSCGRSGS